MTLSKQPVSSFGTELQETLRAGANRTLEIEFDTAQLAIRFSHRINALRAAMKRENHPDWQQLYRCGVYIDKENPRLLRIAPRDSEFRKALLAAGVNTAAPAPVTSVSVSSSPADDFLSTLVEQTTVPPILSPKGEDKC